MSTEDKTTGQTGAKPLRIKPGYIIAILLVLVRIILPLVMPGAAVVGAFSGVALGLALIIWWAFFSRGPGFERLASIVLMILALLVTSKYIDKSISTSMMGMMFLVYSIPVLSLVFFIWIVISRSFTARIRLVTMIIVILLASGFWILLRSNGMDAETRHDFAWRWAKTSEEQMMTSNKNSTNPGSVDIAALKSEAEWPGFRGQHRDGIIHGSKINTDWTKTPPVVIWRKAVGPGCSSFAVHGPFMFTQEQRGNDEMVTCYNISTGVPVWMHGDSTRFWDSHAGAGPRSTPTILNGRIYTLGATGILNVLNESDGSLIWTRNAAKDTKVKLPGWGFTSSPLIVDSTVLIAISGEILAYDIKNGQKRWTGIDGGETYSSPHLISEGGASHVLFLNMKGATVYSPLDGKILWTLPITGSQIVQPAIIDEKDLLINAGDMKGLKRIVLKDGTGGLTPQETWSTDKIKPYFNDIVIHKGHIYGYDGLALVCVDLENGTRKWRGGRYGGQLLLLADQDLLLILTEKGDLALVSATPDKFSELGHIPAIKGKTWNHPVLAGDILLVRNGEEMAAFRVGGTK
jgi:outer membrane protein assembly factor BamB